MASSFASASAAAAASVQLPRLTPLPASYGVPSSSAPLASASAGAAGAADGGVVRLLRFTDRVLVLVQQTQIRPRRGVGCLIQATPSIAPHILPTFDPDQAAPSPAARGASSNVRTSDADDDANASSSGADAPSLALLFGAPTSPAQQTLLDVYAAALTQLLVARGETRPVVCALNLVGGGAEEEGAEEEEEREGERLRDTLRALEELL